MGLGSGGVGSEGRMSTSSTQWAVEADKEDVVMYRRIEEMEISSAKEGKTRRRGNKVSRQDVIVIIKGGDQVQTLDFISAPPISLPVS